MTFAECEIVAQAGARLREIAERLTMPPSFTGVSTGVLDMVSMMDAAALNLSEVYGLLSSLPLETEV